MPARLALGWFLLVVLVAVPEAQAHRDDQSYLYLRIYDDGIEIRVEVTADDLNRALPFTLPTGRGVPIDSLQAAIDARLDEILAYVDARLFVGTEAGPLDYAFKEQRLRRVRTGDFLLLTYETAPMAEIPDALLTELSILHEVDEEHGNFVLIEHNWKTSTFANEAGISLVLTPENPRQVLDLSSSTTWNGFVGMVRFGVVHILGGLDHVLFLLALILPSVLFRDNAQWRPVERFRSAFINIVKIVTFFTIAHSVTLSLAALDVVDLPSVLVESLIALSIAVAALHNIFPRFIKHEAAIAFGFGLFHGFGFASLLEPLGLGRDHTVLTLLGFNVGVEIGQVAIIALLFPLLFVLRKRPWYPRAFMVAGSVLLIAASLFWFVERAIDPPFIQDLKQAVKPVVVSVFPWID